MRDEARTKRAEEIEAAAYRLLEERGYDGLSMQAVAKAAKASNETLYRWYGDKDGLFLAMVRDNAAAIRDQLERALASDAPPLEALSQLGPVFLRMLLGERAILLNRAAAADPSGQLGAAISSGGRGEIQPLLARVMAGLCRDTGHDPAQAVEEYLGLLIGDQQIRRVIGEVPVPSEAEIARRSSHALTALVRLIGG